MARVCFACLVCNSNVHASLAAQDTQPSRQASSKPSKQDASAQATVKPPYLGNAIRNNWADQNSIVIWTRTTAQPEMLAGGKKFKRLSRKKADALAQKTDADELLNVQLPDGATLEQMIGACPGSPGEVRLTYFEVDAPQQSQSTAWVTTEAASDFTANWKLEGLKPGVVYTAVVEAKPVGGEDIAATVRGRFETAPKTSDGRDLKFCVTTCHDFIRTDNGLAGAQDLPNDDQDQTGLHRSRG